MNRTSCIFCIYVSLFSDSKRKKQHFLSKVLKKCHEWIEEEFRSVLIWKLGSIKGVIFFLYLFESVTFIPIVLLNLCRVLLRSE